MYSKIATVFFICSFSLSLIAQSEHLLDSLINANNATFTFDGTQFEGAGWDFILEKTKASQNLMLGEDHFSNEIPTFTKAVTKHVKFDNFYIEIDPYSTKIIENVILNYDFEQKKKFFEEYGDLFSFYSLKPEYDLLEYLVTSGVQLLGSDQIVVYSDRLVSKELLHHTKNSEAKRIYNEIMTQSKGHLDRFLQNPKNPMFMMTPEFDVELNKLSRLNLSEKEHQIIEDLKRSKTIYKEQNHYMRVRLIMKQVMKDYPLWVNAKNLFKYGANHLTRGESFLGNYDIGNLVTNITESNDNSSFHLMIVGERGFLGSPFRGFPASPVDSKKGFYLSYLQDFFKITEGNNWYVFNLLPLRQALNKNALTIDNENLIRVIKGYDALVIIPEVTAAGFD